MPNSNEEGLFRVSPSMYRNDELLGRQSPLYWQHIDSLKCSYAFVGSISISNYYILRKSRSSSGLNVSLLATALNSENNFFKQFWQRKEGVCTRLPPFSSLDVL